MKNIIENIKTQNSDYIMHIDESTLWTKKIKSKKIGKPFFFSEDTGCGIITYLSHFVNHHGIYMLVINNEYEVDEDRWATCITEWWDDFSQLPINVQKEAEELGLTFKNGWFVKK